jgi:hypothetical protein
MSLRVWAISFIGLALLKVTPKGMTIVTISFKSTPDPGTRQEKFGAMQSHLHAVSSGFELESRDPIATVAIRHVP